MLNADLSIHEQLDVALEELLHRRERIAREAPGVVRSLRLAESYKTEARLWSVHFERVRHRLSWRAALAAEAHARSWARHWLREAAAQGAPIATVHGPSSRTAS
jgi:hypothetical protein